jgi:DNA-binding phage protein
MHIKSSAHAINVLEEKRAAEGLSKREVAKRSGMSHNAFWFACRRAEDVQLWTLISFADALNMEVHLVEKALS